MSKNKPSNTFNIVALVILLVVAVGGFFYVKPLWDDVSSKEKGLDEKVVARRELNDKLVNLQKLQQELGHSSEVKKETTLLAVPEQFEQNQLIEILSSMALKNDMILNGISFSVPGTASPGEVSTATLNANLTGNETNLIDFLKDLEGSSRKLLVKNITIQVGENDLGLSRVNFNLNMETYYQGAI